MAQIKFSGLISGMKGKVNGSVVQGNGSNVILRNNKYGSSRKSQKLQSKKAIMASLSSSWRNLSEEQQGAWVSAGVDFPRKNRFGDVRTPSGYNLFMWLNASRISANLSLLVWPPANVEIPSDTEIPFYMPEVYQYVAQRVLPSYVNGSYSVSLYSEAPELLCDVTKRTNFAVNVEGLDKMALQLLNGQGFALFRFDDSAGQSVSLWLGKDGAGALYLAGVVNLQNVTPDPAHLKFMLPLSHKVLGSWSSVGLSVQIGATSGLGVFVNGMLNPSIQSSNLQGEAFTWAEIIANPAPNVTAFDLLPWETFTPTFRAFEESTTYPKMLSLTRVVVTSEPASLPECSTDGDCPDGFACYSTEDYGNICGQDCVEDEWGNPWDFVVSTTFSKIHAMQKTGLEVAELGVGLQDSSTMVGFGFFEDISNLTIISGANSQHANNIDDLFVRKSRKQPSPSCIIVTPEITEGNFLLQLKNTSPQSNGRRSPTKNTPIAGVYPCNGKAHQPYVFDVKNIFIPPNTSAAQFPIYMQSEDSGVVSSAEGPKKPRKTTFRFKAGAELCSVVN